MVGSTVPLDPVDEPNAFAPAAIAGSAIDIANGFSGYWHPGSPYEIDSDFYLIDTVPGVQNGISVGADLLLVSGVPGENLGTTGTLTVVLPEVTIAYLTIWAEVRYSDGQIGFVEIASGEDAADEIRDDYYQHPVDTFLSTGKEVVFTPREAGSTGTPLYVWVQENGEGVILDRYETVTYTGRHFVEVQTQEYPPLSAWATANADVYTNGRYFVSEAFQLGEVLGSSLQDDIWGAGWLQTIAYGVGNTPPQQTSGPVLSISDAVIAEGSVPGVTELHFDVRLSKAWATPVLVDYFAGNGTATVGTDFQSSLGTLTFAPGQTVQTVTVNVIRDFTLEGNETVKMTLENAAGATIGDGLGIGTIINDDDGSQNLVSPFPGTTGFVATTPLVDNHTAFSTTAATFDAVTGWYTAGGNLLDEFGRGVRSLLPATAEDMLQKIYGFAVDSTDPKVQSYLDAWLATGETGKFVQQQVIDRVDIAFDLAEGAAGNDPTFDARQKFAAIDSWFETVQSESITKFGELVGPQLSKWLRIGSGHSAVQFNLDIDARDAKAVVTLAAGHHDGWLGSAGNDTVRLGDMGDVAWGGWGNDRLFGEGGNDSLGGGRGDDWLDGGLGVDLMVGGAGNDNYYVNVAGDSVVELWNQGSDTVRAGISYVLGANVEQLVLTGNGGLGGTGNGLNNKITGNGGANLLKGLAGADTLVGGGGNDMLDGGTGSDVIDGGAGIDTASYANAKAAVVASLLNPATNTGEAAGDSYASVENLRGSGYADRLTGGVGSNTLNGGGGNDTLSGGGSADVLKGDVGADRLDGGAGADTLVGGDGADVFQFFTAPQSGIVDHIVDFDPVVDLIWLDDALFSGLARGALPASAFAFGASAVDASDRIIYNGTTGALLFDADGAGGNAAVQFAVLDTHPSLSAADFIVV